MVFLLAPLVLVLALAIYVFVLILVLVLSGTCYITGVNLLRTFCHWLMTTKFVGGLRQVRLWNVVLRGNLRDSSISLMWLSVHTRTPLSLSRKVK